MITVREDGFFHLRGRHVQHSHGRSTEADPPAGAMIALIPTEDDAQRLRLPGGERSEDLHLTLFSLGEGSEYGSGQRQAITDSVIDAVSGMSEVSARLFGVNHWNGDGDKPCWVMGASGPDLEQIRSAISLENLPEQYVPWAPHVCMAYTDDLSLAGELQNRLGDVTFDRVRVAFAGEFTDIVLGQPLTAAGQFRRDLTDTELRSRLDFARMQEEWENTVESALQDILPVRDTQREELVSQVLSAAQQDDLRALESLSVSEESTLAIETVLFGHMNRAARDSGEAQREAAEEQGVKVPEDSLDALTAAVGADLLRSIASVAARVMSISFVQSAVRRALSLVGRPQVSPQEAADEVERDLSELSEAGPRDIIGGVITAAQGEGRRLVMEAAPPAQFYEASELMDTNTCSPCNQVDGTQFETLADASQAYPAGGFRDCLGRTRCRGTIVPVWEE